MQVAFSPYTLTALDLSQRHGALLKVQFEDGACGYADCHPWESIGDLPLAKQCEFLKEGLLTNITARSLYFARLDAEARALGKSLFEDLEVPDSHCFIRAFLMPDQASCVKIKLGKKIEEETEWLKQFLSSYAGRARLDFNAQLSSHRFEQFLKEMVKFSEKIEFYEDPFPYERETWTLFQQNYGIALACDRQSASAIGQSEAAQYLIIKPATQPTEPFYQAPASQKIVVTSYLDHPLGQMCAAYEAGKMSQKRAVMMCGLLSHTAYQSNAFSDRLPPTSGKFQSPGGTGFGFDELLKEKFELSSV